MDLDSKYELGAVAANDSESKTFRAREAATGREVFVHILFGGKPPGGGESLLSILLGRMTDADPAKRAQIVEVADYKGMPFVVTPVLPGFEGVRAWVEKEREPRPEPAPPAADPQSKVGVWKIPPEPAAPSVPEAPGDEFDRLFGTATQAAQNPQPAAPAAPAAPSPLPGARGEGEFTRLFRSTVGDVPAAPKPPAPLSAAAAPVAATAPPPPPAKTGPAEPPPPAVSGPGEFTRMFQAEPLADTPGMPAMPPPPAMPRPQVESPAGEFTQMFKASPPPAGGPPIPPPQPPAASVQPGGFTNLFATPSSGPSSPAQPAPVYGMPQESPLADRKAPPLGGRPAGEFTQLFGTPGTVGAPGVPAAPPPPPRVQGTTGLFSAPVAGPAPAGAPSGPGEYTQVFGSQSSYAATGVAPPQPPAPALQPQTATPPMATPPAAKTQMPIWPVVIVTALVLLAALGLLLYFLGKK
jgi:hypothetical protein